MHGTRNYGGELSAAAVFPHLPDLRVLDVSDTGIGDAAVASMPPGLVELTMTDCSNVTQRVCMDHLMALRVLHSSGTDASHNAIMACRARGCAAPADGILLSDNTKHAVSCLVLLPDGWLVTNESSGHVVLREADKSGSATVMLQVPCYWKVCAFAVLPDGHRVAIGMGHPLAKGGGIFVWDTSKLPRGAQQVISSASIRCDSAVLALAVAHNGCLVAGCEDGKLRVMDVDTGVVTATLAIREGGASLLAALPGSWLASASCIACTVQLWDMGTSTCVSTLVGHARSVTSLAALPDGRLASASWDGTVRLWDIGSRTCVRVLAGHTQPVCALTVLPGNRLACAMLDSTLAVWDTSDVPDTTSARLPRVVVKLVGTSKDSHTLVPLPGDRLATCGAGVRAWQLPPPADDDAT